MVVTNGTSATLLSAPQVPGGNGTIEPVLQAQDGSFLGTIPVGSDYTSYIVNFDASGNVRWTTPNDRPQIPTADGGVIGQSGITYDSNGNATGQTNLLTQSWTGNTYQDGPVEQIAAPPNPQATPPYWSVAQGNLSGNFTSPLCHDMRDQLITEYGTYAVQDASYSRPYPRFTPTCFEATSSAASQYFTFSQINVPSPSLGSPKFGWALVNYPLIVPATRGGGTPGTSLESSDSNVTHSTTPFSFWQLPS